MKKLTLTKRWFLAEDPTAVVTEVYVHLGLAEPKQFQSFSILDALEVFNFPGSGL